MPRRKQPPRLWLLERRGRPGVWVILDGGRQISTGAREEDSRAAETALANYLADRHVPNFGDGHPARVPVAEILNHYGEKHARHTASRVRAGIAIRHLLDFFGDDMASKITPSRCRDYVSWREKAGIAQATARRELVILVAAINLCFKDHKIDRPIPVTLPPHAAPRARHLSRSEVAKLLAGALGFSKGKPRHTYRINYHLARFILLALYTGTRHDAILKLQWMPNTTGGWVDLDNGMLYRRADGAVETVKRKPALPIPPRLMPHLRRWRKQTSRFVIEWAGRPIKGQERRAWASARKRAGLGEEVTPHILKHTCATMLLHAGVSLFDVAGFIGTTEDVVRKTYGHHNDDSLKRAGAAFSGRRNGR